MPLLMGDWRFFVGGPELQLVTSDLQPSGHFKVSSPGLSMRFAPPPDNQFLMRGEGFWNDIGQAVSFTLSGAAPPPPPPGPPGPPPPRLSVTLMFAGHQVSPTVAADPAQDQVWTLVGEFRHALIAGPPPSIPIPDESARRSVFGWYAQITQII
jgi:hypothetical protein